MKKSITLELTANELKILNEIHNDYINYEDLAGLQFSDDEIKIYENIGKKISTKLKEIAPKK